MISDGINGNKNQRYSEFENLSEEFIRPDHALLIAAGMDERMANYFFSDTKPLLNAMHSDNSNNLISPKILKERIKEIQYSACESGLKDSGE